MAKMASPEDLILKQAYFENEIIEICGSRTKCPIYTKFRNINELGQYFSVPAIVGKQNKLVPIDDVTAREFGIIHISNASDYSIGFDLQKDGALLFSHSSSSSGEYLQPGDYIEYADFTPATYSIDVGMHYSNGSIIQQLCPTCTDKLLINGLVPSVNDFYTVSTSIGRAISVTLDIQVNSGTDPDPDPDPGEQLTPLQIEIAMTNMIFDPHTYRIRSPQPVTSTLTIQYFANGQVYTLGTINKGQSIGTAGSIFKSVYDSISYWRAVPSSDSTYRYSVAPNEYQ